MKSIARLKKRTYNLIPGFPLTMGFTLFYLSLIVLIPLAMLFVKISTMGWSTFVEEVTSKRALAAYRLSFGASAIAAMFNGVFGLLTAWVLVRYSFPGKRFINAMIDLPFALPTAVAGITLTAIYAPNGPVGQLLAPLGIKAAFNWTGIVIALIFVGLPFVVRSAEPVLEDLDHEIEEAAYSLGADRWQTFTKVIFPVIMPAVLTGTAMAFARAVGEYGSVVFIAGNMPMKTEIVPLLIITELEQYNYQGATAIAVVMLVMSFLCLLIINTLHKWGIKK